MNPSSQPDTMQVQEVKDEDVMAVDNVEENKLEWRSSRGRGRPRKSLEGAELSLQSAPSAGKRRGRPPGNGPVYLILRLVWQEVSALCFMLVDFRAARAPS